MSALVEREEAKEEGRGTVGGSGTTVLPMDCGLIVAEGHDSLASQGSEVGEQMEMCYVPCQFEMRVGDVARRVVAGHEAGAQVGG